MAYPEDALAPHEKLVLNLHPHAWTLVKPGGPLVVLIIAGIVAKVTLDGESNVSTVVLWLIALGILACIVWFVQRFAYWVTTLFVLTSDRVMYRAGVLSKQSIEIPLERINTVFAHQSLFERILRLGDLEIESASKDGAQSFQDIRRPSDVQKEIYIQMESNENRKYDRIGTVAHSAHSAHPAPAPAAASSAPSVSEQINQLAQLRDQGHISEAEFQAKKTELLNRM